MTKFQMMQKFYENEEPKELVKRLMDLWQNKRITYGCYLVNNIYDDYSYQELLNKGYKKLTKWDINYHLNNLENKINELRQFIEEQETLPFEETQMQVLIKEGKIQYM